MRSMPYRNPTKLHVDDLESIPSGRKRALEGALEGFNHFDGVEKS